MKANNRTFVIAVTGPTGSGKTLGSQKLKDLFCAAGLKCDVLHSDNYYTNIGSDLTLEERASIDYCAPGAIDFPLLDEHIIDLKRGVSIHQPIYSMADSVRSGETILIEPVDVLIVEGLLILNSECIREQTDHSIYLDTPLDLCLSRRLQRDVEERGLDYAYTLNVYEKMIRPAFFKYTEVWKNSVDCILSSTTVEEIESYLEASIDGLLRRVIPYESQFLPSDFATMVMKNGLIVAEGETPQQMVERVVYELAKMECFFTGLPQAWSFSQALGGAH